MSELTSLFSNIASAIRAKTGNTAQISAANFPSAIANIPEGTTVATGSIAATAKSVTIPQAVGKENIALIQVGNTTQTTLILSCYYTPSSQHLQYKDSSNIKTSADSLTWNSAAGTLTSGHYKPTFNGNYNYIAW